jgi:hypothetical protein
VISTLLQHMSRRKRNRPQGLKNFFFEIISFLSYGKKSMRWRSHLNICLEVSGMRLNVLEESGEQSAAKRRMSVAHCTLSARLLQRVVLRKRVVGSKQRCCFLCNGMQVPTVTWYRVEGVEPKGRAIAATISTVYTLALKAHLWTQKYPLFHVNLLLERQDRGPKWMENSSLLRQMALAKRA